MYYVDGECFNTTTNTLEEMIEEIKDWAKIIVKDECMEENTTEEAIAWILDTHCFWQEVNMVEFFKKPCD